MLEITAVRKSFGSTVALRDVDLRIESGEFFALLGPSGCGKTTLLRILGGFEQTDAGAVRLDGERIDQLPPNRRPCHMVFQRYALFPHLDVRRNVGFALELQGLARVEVARRVDEALALVELQTLAARRVPTLSGGQQQRVALARAIASRPRFLLLDEPLSALDLKLRQRMQVELVQLQRRLSITFVFVTHDQEEALTLSDRVAVMRDGRIEQVGSPQAVYDRPATAFVAGFVGQANRLEARMLEARVADVRGLGPLPVAPIGVRAGDRAQILVRPEHLRLLPPSGVSTADDVGPRLSVSVAHVLFKGPHLDVLVRPQAAPGSSASRGEAAEKPTLSVQLPVAGADWLRTGQAAVLCWPPASAQAFAADDA